MPSDEAHEFKILRSSMHRFGKPELLQQAIAEESRYGWTLFEKLDDGRLRLRRPVSCRERDAAVGGDPYRCAANIGDRAVQIKQGLLALLVSLPLLGGLIWLIVRK